MDTHSKHGLDAPLMPEAADTFTEVSVARLAMMPPEVLDSLPYGVIGMATDGTVDVYNAAESRLAGLSPGRVLGQHLFTVVAPCMNNYLVAQRLEDEAELDVVVPYVLTLRMRPTPVKLRLLRTTDQPRRFLLIQR
jgi:photoactive yellow protein